MENERLNFDKEFFSKRKLLLQMQERKRLSFLHWLLKRKKIGKIIIPTNLLWLIPVHFINSKIWGFLGLNGFFTLLPLDIVAMYGVYMKFSEATYIEKEESLIGDIKNLVDKIKFKFF